jgi:hypothetical protein
MHAGAGACAASWLPGAAAGAARAVPTVAALREADAEAGAVVYCAGYHAPGDGGGGLFYWSRDRRPGPLDGGTGRAHDALYVASATARGGHWFRALDGAAAMNVRWFGARGDGEADDAEAINQAIWTAGFLDLKRTYLPAGTYRITQPVVLTWTNGHALEGQGPMSTRLRREGDTRYTPKREGASEGLHAAVVVPAVQTRDGDVQDAPNVTVRNLHIQQRERSLEAQRDGTPRYGLLVERAYQCAFENLHINGFHTSVRALKLFTSRLTNLRTSRCVSFIVVSGEKSESLTQACTSLTLTNCYCGGTVLSDGYVFTRCYYVTLQNCAADYVQGWPYRVRLSQGVVFSGCGVEYTRRGRGFLFEGSTGAVLGCSVLVPERGRAPADEPVSLLAARRYDGHASRVSVAGSFFGNYTDAAATDRAPYNVFVERGSDVSVLNSRLPTNARPLAALPASERGRVHRLSDGASAGAEGNAAASPVAEINLRLVRGSEVDAALNHNFQQLTDALARLARRLDER